MSAATAPLPPQSDLAELDRILSAIEQRLADIRHQVPLVMPEAQPALEAARQIYHRRRRRDTIFKGFELFGEPSWDILLDLFIAFETRQKVAVSSACIGSASPPTTGLRHVDALQDRGLVEREPDPDDGRRVWLRISPRGRDLMLQCLAQG